MQRDFGLRHEYAHRLEPPTSGPRLLCPSTAFLIRPLSLNSRPGMKGVLFVYSDSLTDFNVFKLQRGNAFE